MRATFNVASVAMALANGCSAVRAGLVNYRARFRRRVAQAKEQLLKTSRESSIVLKFGGEAIRDLHGLP